MNESARLGRIARALSGRTIGPTIFRKIPLTERPYVPALTRRQNCGRAGRETDVVLVPGLPTILLGPHEHADAPLQDSASQMDDRDVSAELEGLLGRATPARDRRVENDRVVHGNWIREGWKFSQADKFLGPVEVEESYVDGRESNKGGGHA